jgi:TPR repeat protein
LAIVRLFGVILLASTASLVSAGTDEDFKTGAKMYQSGDMLGGMPLVKKAADAGLAAAQALYGDMILAGGSGDEEALVYFRKAAEQGNADGQFSLGAMYESGEGVKRDVAEGRKWITKAAEQGHSAAINAMALAYMSGGMGIPEEARKGAEALRWIRLAAENNLIAAIRELVKAYKEGGYGLKIDSKLADEWTAKELKLTGVTTDKRGKRGSKK